VANDVSHLFRVTLLVIALTCAGIASAQEPARTATTDEPDRGVTAYSAAFFVDLNAITALDMVRQVPGFTFVDTDNSRGYAGAGGNVLIGGRRPSTKTTRLQQILQRIPASAVERVEVVRGGTPGYDTQGLPVVANIVRQSGTSSSNALMGAGKFLQTGDVSLIGRAERIQRDEDSFFEGSIELRKEQDDEEIGEGDITRWDADGNLIEDGTFFADHWSSRFRALGAFEKITEGGLFRANFGLSHQINDERDVSESTDTFGNESRDVVDTDFSNSGVEIGADYEGNLSDSTTYQIVAVQTLGRKEDDANRTSEGGSQFATEDQQEGETILRGLLRRTISPQLNFEAGAEGAFNFLNSETALEEDGQVIDLPAANVEVEELRSEIYSTLMWQASPRTSLEFGLRGETSKIKVTGDADAENRFSFLKPRVVGSYSSDGGTQLRLRVEREVGQLDFEDFAAGSELTDNTVNAGNPDLAPEQAWVIEAAFERPVFGDSALTFTYRHFEMEDVVDIIPFEGFAAPGNIGDGTRDEYGIAFAVPLDSIGPGLGRLQLSGTWRDSEVVDPVTGETREISGEPGFDGTVLYTREFPKLNGSFGIRGELTSKETDYRLDQIITTRNDHYWRVYWDWRVRPSLQVRAMLENATSRDRWRRRVRYDGLRSDGIIESRDERSAVLDPMLVFRIRWTF